MTRLLFLTLSLLLVACSPGNGPGVTSDPLGPKSPGRDGEGRIHLDLGQSATIGRDGWRITFAAVEADSRCPANVQCPWAGNGRIRLDLIDADRGTTPVVLNTSTEPRGITIRGLQIDLIELQPYPDEPGSVSPDSYSVTLSVTEP